MSDGGMLAWLWGFTAWAGDRNRTEVPMSDLTLACVLIVLIFGGGGAVMLGLTTAFPTDPENPPPPAYGSFVEWGWKPFLVLAAVAAPVGVVAGLWDLARWIASW